MFVDYVDSQLIQYSWFRVDCTLPKRWFVWTCMDQRTSWGVVPSTLKLFLISPAAVLGAWKYRRHPEEPDPRVVQRSAAPSHQLQQRPDIERKRFGHWLIIFGTEIYYKNKLYIYTVYNIRCSNADSKKAHLRSGHLCLSNGAQAGSMSFKSASLCPSRLGICIQTNERFGLWGCGLVASDSRCQWK